MQAAKHALETHALEGMLELQTPSKHFQALVADVAICMQTARQQTWMQHRPSECRVKCNASQA
eukprot:6197535-Pleurochrysis_carterae.AAC.1